MSFIVKQPNGRYARFSTIVDCVTHYNMTEQDYIDMRVERAKEDAEIDAKNTLKYNIRPYEEIEKYLTWNNTTREEFEELKKKMESEVE